MLAGGLARLLAFEHGASDSVLYFQFNRAQVMPSTPMISLT